MTPQQKQETIPHAERRLQTKEEKKKKTELSLTVSYLHLQTDSSHHHKSPARIGTTTEPLVILIYIHGYHQYTALSQTYLA